MFNNSFTGKRDFPQEQRDMSPRQSSTPVTSVIVKPQNSFPKFQSEPSDTTRHGSSLLPARTPAVALAPSAVPAPHPHRIPGVTDRGCRTRAGRAEGALRSPWLDTAGLTARQGHTHSDPRSQRFTIN